MKRKQHSIDFVFVLILFCFFTFASLSVVQIGFKIYQSITTTMENNFQINTPSQYVIEKIHRDYFQGNIELTTIDNKNALAIHTSDNYITYLYQDNNNLKEFFTQETTKPTLASGDAIMDLDDLKIEKVNDHLIKLTFYYSSLEEETYVSIL